MHLPGPLRAAVGLVVSAAEEAKHLPDRAIELPMLAVSSALQMSLRAQQRYARLAARGDQVLNRRPAGDEPPEWATFDEPVSLEELRRTALAQLDSLGDDNATGRMLEEMFGADSPDRTRLLAEPRGKEDDTVVGEEPPDNVTPIVKTPTKKAGQRAKAGSAGKAASAINPTAAKSTPAKKAPTAQKKISSQNTSARARAAATKATPIKSTDAAATAAKKAAAKKAAAGRAKTVNKPRHTTPSKFDDVAD